MTRSLFTILCLTAALPVATAAGNDSPVATVGGEPIPAVEARQMLDVALRGKNLSPEALPFARAQVLEEIVSRRLVLAYAVRLGGAATDEELAAAKARALTQAAAQGRTLAAVLGAASAGEDDLRRQLAWNVTWQKYLGRYLTAAREESYFQAHRRELDGTELLVRHVLLRGSAAKPEASDELMKRAEEIRGQIVTGKLSLAEAAKRYSAGPSAREGGRLGWIGRHGPMDEAFSRAAFALEVGQVSPPVRTAFGVHLIACDEVRPGSNRLADVRREVEDALSRELLEKLARLQRPHTPVAYTAAWPHFKPGTRELAAP